MIKKILEGIQELELQPARGFKDQEPPTDFDDVFMNLTQNEGWVRTLVQQGSGMEGWGDSIPDAWIHVFNMPDSQQHPLSDTTSMIVYTNDKDGGPVLLIELVYPHDAPGTNATDTVSTGDTGDVEDVFAELAEIGDLSEWAGSHAKRMNDHYDATLDQYVDDDDEGGIEEKGPTFGGKPRVTPGGSGEGGVVTVMMMVKGSRAEFDGRRELAFKAAQAIMKALPGTEVARIKPKG